MYGEDSIVDNSVKLFTLPQEVSEKIFKHFAPSGRGIDPFKTETSFYQFMDKNDRDWCNGVESKRDFNTYKARANYVMGFPPFGLYADCLIHAMSLADDIMLVGTMNHAVERAVVEAMADRGYYMKEVMILSQHKGLQRTVFPLAAIWYKKGEGRQHMCMFGFEEGTVCQPTLELVI